MHLDVDLAGRCIREHAKKEVHSILLCIHDAIKHKHN